MQRAISSSREHWTRPVENEMDNIRTSSVQKCGFLVLNIRDYLCPHRKVFYVANVQLEASLYNYVQLIT